MQTCKDNKQPTTRGMRFPMKKTACPGPATRFLLLPAGGPEPGPVQCVCTERCFTISYMDKAQGGIPLALACQVFSGGGGNGDGGGGGGDENGGVLLRAGQRRGRGWQQKNNDARGIPSAPSKSETPHSLC